MRLDNNKGKQLKNVAVIDIGSNSVRLVIYEVYGAAFVSVYDEKVLAGLGRSLKTNGMLNDEAKRLALSALKRFALIIKARNPDKTSIVATAAMREAKDAKNFIDLVKKETRLDISPISGEREAVLSASGVIALEPRAKGLAADLGGASLELVCIDKARAFNGVSYKLGPFAMLSPSNMYGSQFNAASLKSEIYKKLKSTPYNNGSQNFENQPLYLIGGAWRNLANIQQKRANYPLKLEQNYEMSISDAKNLAKWAYSNTGITELLSWPNISKRRADTLPYSGLLLDVLIEQFSPSSIIIAPGGLRDGIVFETLGINPEKALLDGCERLVTRPKAREFGHALFKFLEKLTDEKLLEKMETGFDAQGIMRIFRAACMLSGVGIGLHARRRAGIVYNIALSGPLAGLTHKERAFLALVLYRSFRSEKKPPSYDVIEYLLNLNEQKYASILGLAIRAIIVLSGRSEKLLQDGQLSVEQGHVSLCLPDYAKPLVIKQAKAHFDRLAELLGMKLDIR